MKKFISISLCIAMILTTAIIASATYVFEPNIDPDENNNIVLDRNENFVQGNGGALTATPEQMEQWENAEKQVKNPNINSKTVRNNTSSSRGWEYIDPMSDFWYYGQELSMSCGAACVRMALQFLTGTTYAEDTIRTGCGTSTSGTYLSNMVTYINNEPLPYYDYIVRYKQTKATMKANLYDGVTLYNNPPIIGVHESTADGWPYTLSSGHFVIIYGAYSDESSFYIADPWAGYKNENNNRWYSISSDDLYTGYSVDNLGYMF